MSIIPQVPSYQLYHSRFKVVNFTFSRYQVNVDLSDVERILRQPGPSVLRSDIHYDVSKERKVLQDIEKSRKEEEERDEARRLRIQKYDEEKAEEEDLRSTLHVQSTSYLF